MSLKGSKHSLDAKTSADFMLNSLQGIDGISSKRMFGGYGIFHEARMFAMVTSKGEIFFKTDESNRSDFTDLDCPKHIKMPYYMPPDHILEVKEAFQTWAKKSILVSKKVKKK